MRKTKGKGMMINHKTSTYMGLPYHSLLWSQWTAETMNLGMRKEEDGGMDGGRERNTMIKIKPIFQIKWDKHGRT